ncbi:MAG: right-handed parallel beta-helix repeat-containing protein [Thermoplasmatota archaeon]
MKASIGKKGTVFIAVLLVVLSVTPPFTPLDDSRGSVITVDDDTGADYQSIQEAVDHASAGDTVMIYGGVYDGGVTVNKSLELVGDSRENSVIRSVGSDYGIKMTSEGIDIDNLTIKDFQVGVWSCDDLVNVSRCSLVDNSRGIFLDDVDQGSINNSSIENGTEGIYSMRADELSLDDITALEQSERGFRFVNCSSTSVTNCITENSGYHPLYISQSTDFSVENCTFNSTGRGSYLYRSRNISSSENHFEYGVNIDGDELEGWNSHSFVNDTVRDGEVVYLKNRRGSDLRGVRGQLIAVNTSDSVFFDSYLSDVEAGLILVNSSFNDIIGNTFSENFEGFKLFRSEGNEIHHNNFENNTRQLNSPDGSSQTNIWSDGLGDGNYWDDYEGLDNGNGGRYVGDGVGDTDLSHPIEDHGYGYHSLDPNPLMNRTKSVNRSIYLDKTKSDWHLISTGMVTAYEEFYKLLANIEKDYDKLMYYSAEKDRWHSYSEDRPDHFNDMPSVNRSMGFWIHLKNSTYLNISGISCARTKVDIHPGWNIVGVSCESAISNASLPAFVDKAGVYNSSREYDIEYHGGTNLTFTSGEAFWINSGAEEVEDWNQVWKG